MTDPNDQWIQSAADVLRQHPEVAHLEAGLSDSEIAGVEERFGFTFPPDLRALLQYALPIGPRFLNWRNDDSSDLISRLKVPLEGIWFDVEHNDFWVAEWGVKPADPVMRFQVVKGVVDAAPRLIPIYIHRFIPSEPAESGIQSSRFTRRISSTTAATCLTICIENSRFHSSLGPRSSHAASDFGRKC